MPERRRFGMTPLAEAAGRAARPVLRAHGFALPAILTEWSAIVGEALAEASAPERLSRTGTLCVRVAGGRAVELQHRAPVILERLACYFGHRAVMRLRLIQGPLPVRRRRAPVAPPAPTPHERREVERLTAPLGDARLKAALSALGRVVLAEARRRLEAGPQPFL